MNSGLFFRTARCAVVLALISAGLWPAESGVSAATARTAAAPPAALGPVPGEVIVRFKSGSSTTRRFALASNARAESVHAMLAARATALGTRVGLNLETGAAVGEGIQVVRLPGADAQALAKQLAADPEVEFAVPNARRRRLTAPNDPLYAAAQAGVRPRGPDAGQWYLRAPDTTFRSAIGVETAWNRTMGTNTIVVAVLDTGVRFDHPDLSGRTVPGYDFVSSTVLANDGDGRDSDASDPGDWVTAQEANQAPFAPTATDPVGCSVENSSWHGTSTAGIIGAATNNGLGMAGVAPGVRIQPIRVLGKCFGDNADIQAAMRWAAGIHIDGVPDNPTPARIINLSLGGSGSCQADEQAAIDDVLARGVVVVAAAGNSAGEPAGAPANCRGVIGVAALRHFGTKVGFSDLGSSISIAAPGGNCINTGLNDPCLYPILSATNTGLRGPSAYTNLSDPLNWTDSYNASTGTSFSSPLVAGVAALMVSRQPLLTPAQVRSLLQSTARAFPSSGADNGPDDSTVVVACTTPQVNVSQYQCYCPNAGAATYPLCGAGMLDAGAAVAAAGGTVAGFTTTPTAPAAGSAVTLNATASVANAGTAVVAWAWAVTDTGGIVSDFTGAKNAATASITPSAAGTFSVRLTVTDNTGVVSTTTQSVVVAAAPNPSSGGSSKGGGALDLASLALLAAALGVAARASGLSARRRA